MTIELIEIPGLEPRQQTVWRVRALVVDGRNPVLTALVRWQREHPEDYKTIMKVMRIAGQQYRVKNPKLVKKSTDDKHGNAYEMIAYTRIARLMFFYDEEEESLIVCTNEFEKGHGNQSAAFERCAAFRELYLKQKPKRP